MSKKRNIHLKAIFLLLIYLVINIPFVLFHHHENDIVAYSEASPCEKSIYYKNAVGTCNHDVHISQVTEKCRLCEHHVAAPHILIAFFIPLFFTEQKEISHYPTTSNYIFQISYIASNKGPPTV
jgi:hypothetical protein